MLLAIEDRAGAKVEPSLGINKNELKSLLHWQSTARRTASFILTLSFHVSKGIGYAPNN
jgi:hypothetical protein